MENDETAQQYRKNNYNKTMQLSELAVKYNVNFIGIDKTYTNIKKNIDNKIIELKDYSEENWLLESINNINYQNKKIMAIIDKKNRSEELIKSHLINMHTELELLKTIQKEYLDIPE
ncbi:hypothetical protein K9L97_05065 [Candidatus Woesearchaeota archaeon]|nr:hypothetical protein [Candidatus Woesearchaeota archaeon]